MNKKVRKDIQRGYRKREHRYNRSVYGKTEKSQWWWWCRLLLHAKEESNFVMWRVYNNYLSFATACQETKYAV